MGNFPDYQANDDGSGAQSNALPVESGSLDVSDEVILDGIRIRTSFVQFQSLEPFPRKSSFGNATNDSDQYFTTSIYDNLAGGHGLEDMNETTDINRYFIGTMMTRWPNGICKPFRAQPYTPIPAVAGAKRFFIGMLYVPAQLQYVDFFAYGGNAYWGDGQTLLGATLADPTDAGCEFQGTDSLNRLIWPTGNGYGRVSGGLGFTNVASSATVPAATSMCVWGASLLAIDTVNQLWHSENISAGWDTYTGAKLPYSQFAQKLIPGYDRGGQRCVYIVTNRTVWQFVAEGQAIVEVPDFAYPTHRYSGIASCLWNGDEYVASGMNVMRYNSGAKQYVGLDRDDGLPLEYQGYITDLIPSDRGIYAFVNWRQVDPSVVRGYSTIHEFNGVGWQMVWKAPDVTYSFTSRSMGITQSGTSDRYRLYFGLSTVGNVCSMSYIDFPLGPVQPRQVPTLGQFATGTFDLTTSWFDAQLSGYIKLGNAVEFQLNRMTALSRFRMWCQIDDENSDWIYLGESSANGVSSFSLGDSAGREAKGLPFIRIRFKWELEDHTLQTPYISYVSFSCIQVPYPLMTFTVPIDYSKATEGVKPDDLHKLLLDAYETPQFSTLMWKGRLYRGRITQYQGAGAPGQKELTSGSISFLGMPESIAKQWFRNSVR